MTMDSSRVSRTLTGRLQQVGDQRRVALHRQVFLAAKAAAVGHQLDPHLRFCGSPSSLAIWVRSS